MDVYMRLEEGHIRIIYDLFGYISGSSLPHVWPI